MPMIRLVRLTSVLTVVALAGCHVGKTATVRPERGSSGRPAQLEVMEAIRPLRLGMTKEEVEGPFPADPGFWVLISPSQMSDGGVFRLENGVEVWYAYGRDERVVYLSSSDRSLRLAHGIGVGTTYGQIKARMPDCEPICVRGYGTFIGVAPNQWALFERIEGDLKDYERVAWIEIRESPWSY